MTQDDWLTERNRLLTGGSLEVSVPYDDFRLVVGGVVNPVAADALVRWCVAWVGLEPIGITAPTFDALMSMKRGDVKARFSHYEVGTDLIGIFITDPDADGRSRKGQFDRCYVIPDMPLPEDRDWPEGWKEWPREKRRAHIQAERPGRLLLEALALAHLAEWLSENVPEGD